MLPLILALLAAAGPDRSGRTVDVQVQTLVPTPEVWVAYRGAGWFLHVPGASARVSWDLLERRKTVSRPWKARPDRRRRRQLYGGVEVGASVLPANDTILPVQAVLGTRKTWDHGLCTGVFLAAGLAASLPHHPTWSLDGGQPQRGWRGARASFAPALGWEAGWDLAHQGGGPISVLLRPTVTVLTGWQPSAVPLVHVDLAVRLPVGRGARP